MCFQKERFNNPSRKFTSHNSGFSTIDAILILIIILCACFIGYRLLQVRQTVQNGQESRSTKSNLIQPTTLPVRPSVVFRDISDQAWQKLIGSEMLKRSLASTSDGCKDNLGDTEALSIVSSEILERAKAGHWRTLPALSQPPCVRLNQQLNVYYFDRRPEATVAIPAGSVTVQSILQSRLDLLPNEFFDFLNVTREGLSTYVKLNRGGPAPPRETILRVTPLKAAAENSSGLRELPPALPRGRIVKMKNLEALKALRPDLLLIDVRSPEEFQKGNTKSAINVPYLKAGVSVPPNWISLKNSEIWALSQFLTRSHNTNRPIAILSPGKDDPRGYWAALDLFDLKVFDVYLVTP